MGRRLWAGRGDTSPNILVGEELKGFCIIKIQFLFSFRGATPALTRGSGRRPPSPHHSEEIAGTADIYRPRPGVLLSVCLRVMSTQTQQLMLVPRHRLSTVGRRAFAVHCPMACNSLPDDLRARQDYESFTQGLKTCLFSRY